MIGSIDMLASRSSMPVTSMATTGRLSGIDAQPPLAAWRAFGGRLSSLIRNSVARKDRKITAPAQKNVLRMPISGGRNPPANGPTRLPAITPDDSVPNAQPARSLGVWVATRTTDADE